MCHGPSVGDAVLRDRLIGRSAWLHNDELASVQQYAARIDDGRVAPMRPLLSQSVVPLEASRQAPLRAFAALQPKHLFRPATWNTSKIAQNFPSRCARDYAVERHTTCWTAGIEAVDNQERLHEIQQLLERSPLKP